MTPFRAVKNIRRLNEIFTVLIKHGFGEVMDRLGLPATIALRLRLKRPKRPPPPPREAVGVRLRAALEELGPTFVKLGQMLALRPELASHPVAVELSRLHAHVTPVAPSEARAVLEAELGRERVASAFVDFEPSPVASGSLGQVHRAQLVDGREVAVKIQRPGIRPVVESDLDILGYLASKVEGRVPELGPLRPAEVVEELARALLAELDYLNELANIRAFAAAHAERHELVVPEVHPELCTRRVLVMQFLPGRHLAPEQLPGAEAGRVARGLVQLELSSIFEHGFFHSDPHPGNIMLMQDGRIGLLDYGQMGWLSRPRVDSLIDLTLALNAQDAESVTRVLMRLGDSDAPWAEARIIHQVKPLMVRYYKPGAKQAQIGKLIEELLRLAAEQNVFVPSELTLVVKSLLITEDLVHSLARGLDLAEEIRPFVKRVMLERLSPSQLSHNLQRQASELSQAAIDLPRYTTAVARKLARGQLSAQLQHRGLESLIDALEHVSNRLSFALVIAALIVGSSILTQSEAGPRLWGLPSFGFLGFLMAALLGLGLLFSIIRSGRW